MDSHNFFLEDAFRKNQFALLDIQYLAEKRTSFSKKKVKSDPNEEGRVNVYHRETLHIICYLLCDPRFIRVIYKSRKGLRIPPLKGFYTSNGNYDKKAYTHWREEIIGEKKERTDSVLKGLQIIQESCSIPSFWMEFIEDFLIKGIYNFPTHIVIPVTQKTPSDEKSLEEKDHKEILTNYDSAMGIQGGGLFSDSTRFYPRYEKEFPQYTIMNRSRYGIIKCSDGSYSIRVFPKITRHEDIENAWQEIKAMGKMNPVGYKKVDSELEAFCLFLQKSKNGVFDKNIELDANFRKDLFAVLNPEIRHSSKNTYDSKEPPFSNWKNKNLKDFLKNWDWWILTQKI